jgi:hypothetical protein
MNMKPKDGSIIQWLFDNGFPEVANNILALKALWRSQGNGTRRNWWDVLAGGFDGRPITIGGITFPVLAVAQRRQGMPVTKNAIRCGRGVRATQIVATGRWHPSMRKKKS